MDDVALRGLLEQAGRWQLDDPDPSTRAELTELLALVTGSVATTERDEARAELADRFAGTLEFGTAGLRGAMGAGPNRMNRAVVVRAAAGLAAYLLERVPGFPGIVVGYDARHDSDVFARDTCAVAVGAGCVALVLPKPLPTPVLAFAVHYFAADAGVMVTASHNPAQDNGYKVYLGGRVETGPGRGVQIVPPADAAIAAAIAAVGPVLGVPLAEDGWNTVDDGLLAEYLHAVTSLVNRGGLRGSRSGDHPRELDIVLTPLHGVGGETVVAALTGAGFAAPYVVPQQARPDPDFPTVAFPNPEEPGAIDLAVAAARQRFADLVIANDPDADRCAVAVPDPWLPRHPDGGPNWRMLRGDELGALLGRHLLTRGWLAPMIHDRVLPGLPPGSVVASSIVSSQLLGKIAAAHGVPHVETLTGFKWIARVPNLAFGYEEALGYCVAPNVVRDKDGISAALLVAELAAGLKARGLTLIDALDDLARTYGVYATDQLAVRVADLSLIADAMCRLRAAPPTRLGGADVISVEDLLEPAPEADGGLPPTDGLRLRTADAVRIVVRPSGTEPKLKCYLESVIPLAAGATDLELAAARAVAAERLAAVRTDLAALITPDPCSAPRPTRVPTP